MAILPHRSRAARLTAAARTGLAALALSAAAGLQPVAAQPSAPGPATPAAPAATPAAGQGALRLRVVGGLAGLNQYTRHEEPFWTDTLHKQSGGQFSAEIVPFDRAGIRGQEMLRLMQIGVVPFGTLLLSQSAVTEPLLAAPDLAGLNPDMASLRRTIAAFRPLLARTLRERHGVELLAVYTYPAQVLYCKQAFQGLDDLRGRRVRVSGTAQADWIEALGGTPVSVGFAGIVDAFRAGNIDCAITGTMSGNTIGLHEHTSHVHPMAVTWGLAAFGANQAAWKALRPDWRALLERELPRLEQAIWSESDRETGEGLACNAGQAGCVNGKRGRMTAVRATDQDERRRREILAANVLPRWLQRCGPACADTWNQTLGPLVGLSANRP